MLLLLQSSHRIPGLALIFSFLHCCLCLTTFTSTPIPISNLFNNQAATIDASGSASFSNSASIVSTYDAALMPAGNVSYDGVTVSVIIYDWLEKPNINVPSTTYRCLGAPKTTTSCLGVKSSRWHLQHPFTSFISYIPVMVPTVSSSIIFESPDTQVIFQLNPRIVFF